jgi:hypothetical protein
MNSTLPLYPDRYLEKIFASEEFSSFVDTPVLFYLQNKIKNSNDPDEDTIALMIKLCSSFLNIGLVGILKKLMLI